MTTYGQSVRWSQANGTTTAVTVSGCSTPQEALREAVESAKVMGWTPPKWWQWWRWKEPVRSDFPQQRC